MKKNIGIWIDKKKAKIVTIENDSENLKTLESNVEDFHIGGGSGTKMKGGPQDVVQDSKYLEREKHQLKDYFKDVIQEIKSADQLVIFGPAETNEKLRKELNENYQEIGSKVKGVIKADSMTDNQIIALVREYYKNNG
ncbi:hypothetical protein [Urechidicola croceus]|uniref:Host attachment protein n=1 Tax=Urechidicola croceus TaxID=1850246 RepID=A0A1D8P7W9_9FLAO|nr:hypothetical protein [Urechidicola croceus]AOW20668.1 hypothetical protein LPB138_08260 [Urechidicola croceus]